VRQPAAAITASRAHRLQLTSIIRDVGSEKSAIAAHI
jgi:hypothetical protein